MMFMGLVMLQKVVFFLKWPSSLFLCSLHELQRQSQPRWVVHATCFMDIVLHSWPSFLSPTAKQG